MHNETHETSLAQELTAETLWGVQAPHQPDPEVNGAELLDQVKTFIRKFVIVSDAQATALAAFIVYTYAKDEFSFAPYVQITSAEKQCGKSRLLEVLAMVVNKPWLTVRVSAAALVRKLAADHSVLLLDESDAAFKGNQEYSEALRGVLNSGNQKGAECCLCIGKNNDVASFDVFGPKVIGGIGKLPDTVRDRCVPIQLQRKSRTEQVDRLRRRKAKPLADTLRAKLAKWLAGDKVKGLAEAEPALPESLTDRQQDVAEPLLAVVDLAGGDWPKATRAALVELWSGAVAEDASIRVRLLTDIREVFDALQAEDKIHTENLISELKEIETSPWGDWNHGKVITSQALAKLLQPFGIAPKTVRLAGGVLKGYAREQFVDAWERYLRPDVTAPDPVVTGNVTGKGPAETPVTMPIVTPVTAVTAFLQGDTPKGGNVVTTQSTLLAHCWKHGEHDNWWRTSSGDPRCGLCYPATEIHSDTLPLTTRVCADAVVGGEVDI